MENTPNAAAAPATEATPNTNSNPASVSTSTTPPEPQTPAITLEAVAEYLGTTPEGLESFTKFSKANGGLDKAFGKMKQTISNPQSQPQAQTSGAGQQFSEPKVTAIEPNQVQQPPVKPAEGFITPNEYFAQKLNEDLATKYPEISDYIKKGEYLKDGTAWGMTLVDQAGNMNLKVINEFLEMKAKAVAPTPVSTPVTTIPTVEYTNTEGEITSQETADAIMRQGSSHPRYQDATKYTRERIFGKTPEPKQK